MYVETAYRILTETWNGITWKYRLHLFMCECIVCLHKPTGLWNIKYVFIYIPVTYSCAGSIHIFQQTITNIENTEYHTIFMCRQSEILSDVVRLIISILVKLVL